jgi:DNA polymerase-1
MRAAEGKKIRRAFIVPEGKKIVKGDMDQVELRKMACLSNCKAMLDAFKAGRDIHAETARRAYGNASDRFPGKTLNFKLVYGGGTPEEQKILFEIYPEVKAWTDSMSHEFEVLGYARTHHGRKRHLGNFERMSRKEIAHACREGISTMDQGSCAEYLKIGMRKVWNEIHDSDVKMLLQVHDELVFECPNKDVPELVDSLRRNLTYTELQIPLTVTVSVGSNWADTVDIGGKK